MSFFWQLQSYYKNGKKCKNSLKVKNKNVLFFLFMSGQTLIYNGQAHAIYLKEHEKSYH